MERFVLEGEYAVDPLNRFQGRQTCLDALADLLRVARRVNTDRGRMLPIKHFEAAGHVVDLHAQRLGRSQDLLTLCFGKAANGVVKHAETMGDQVQQRLLLDLSRNGRRLALPPLAGRNRRKLGAGRKRIVRDRWGGTRFLFRAGHNEDAQDSKAERAEPGAPEHASQRQAPAVARHLHPPIVRFCG